MLIHSFQESNLCKNLIHSFLHKIFCTVIFDFIMTTAEAFGQLLFISKIEKVLLNELVKVNLSSLLKQRSVTRHFSRSY